MIHTAQSVRGRRGSAARFLLRMPCYRTRMELQFSNIFCFFGRESCLWDSRSAIIKENTEAGDDMTRKERILDAKRCLDALALGLDPHTGGELPGDSVLNRVEMSRCFFFVSGLLQEIYDNGPRAPGLPFALPIEQRAAFPFTEQPMTVSEICRALNEMVDPFVYRYLRTTTITDWLLQHGFLEMNTWGDGTPFRGPTALGRSIGLSVEERSGKRGPYQVTLYHPDAQHFILDNLDDILLPVSAAAE